MLAYKRHKRKEFWINLFLQVSEKLNLSYDSLREKEVVEFFFILKQFDSTIKPENNGRGKQD